MKLTKRRSNRANDKQDERKKKKETLRKDGSGVNAEGKERGRTLKK